MPITDLEVGPDGNIYLTTGGGQGQGGLYKIVDGAKPAQPDMSGFSRSCVSSRSRFPAGAGTIEKVKASMGASFGPELEKLARNAAAAANDRVRALLEMQRHGGSPNAALLQALIKDRNADAQPPCMSSDFTSSDNAKAVAASGLKDANALVQRRAAEALVRQGLTPTAPSFAPVADIYALLRSGDRFVRYSGRVALEHTPRNEWTKMVMAETNVTALTEGLVALANTAPEAQAQSSCARCSRSWCR